MKTKPPPAHLSSPAISVIIPMYNTEKYIAECLDSLLKQTFKNFEIIVVDDCSTDSSCAVVERYVPKFGGRLKLEKTKKNSGGCAVPRNIGLPFSRGEYVYFMDSDDLITSTALQELYVSAKNFGADVVYTERWYDVPENFKGAGVDNNFVLRTTDEKNFSETPILESDDITQRVLKLIEGKFHAVVWKKLVLRDLLIRNEIDFPNFRVEDFCWTLELLYYAKKNLTYTERDLFLSPYSRLPFPSKCAYQIFQSNYKFFGRRRESS